MEYEKSKLKSALEEDNRIISDGGMNLSTRSSRPCVYLLCYPPSSVIVPFSLGNIYLEKYETKAASAKRRDPEKTQKKSPDERGDIIRSMCLLI